MGMVGSATYMKAYPGQGKREIKQVFCSIRLFVTHLDVMYIYASKTLKSLFQKHVLLPFFEI